MTTVLKRRLSADDSSLTPRSRLLAVAMTLKPLRAWTSVLSSAIGQRLLRQDGDQRVLHVGRDPRQLLEPRDMPALHGEHDGRRHQRSHRRPLGQQQGVVPAIADGLLGGARPVPCTSRVESPEMAAARCSDTHDFATPGKPSSSKRAIGRQRGDRDFDQPSVADVLGTDVEAVVAAARPAGTRSPPTATAARMAAALGRRSPPSCSQLLRQTPARHGCE